MNYNSQHAPRTPRASAMLREPRPAWPPGPSAAGGGAGAGPPRPPARLLSAPPGRAMWQSIGLTLLVIVATLACVLLFMLCGECRGAEGGCWPGCGGRCWCSPPALAPPRRARNLWWFLSAPIDWGKEKGTVPWCVGACMVRSALFSLFPRRFQPRYAPGALLQCLIRHFL